MLDITKLHESVQGLDPDFRYPVGYFELPRRVRGAKVLADYDVLLHPYVVERSDGEVQVDSASPHMLGYLQNRLNGDTDSTLRSARNFLELGGLPDASMQATYELEDQCAWASLLSEVGHHGPALSLLDQLPKPFQESNDATYARLRSFKALGRFAEALPLSVDLMERYRASHAHRYQLQVIVTAELLVECGQMSEAEALLDSERKQLVRHYTYYGVRAALALKQGDVGHAQLLIQRATAIDTFHCYKLVWQRALAPLHQWMQSQLLTDCGKSRPYEEQSALLKLCRKIQGAAFSGEFARGKALADALVPQKCHAPCDSHILLLAWLSVGDFARARRWASALQRFPCDDTYQQVEQVCDLFLAPDDPSRASPSFAPDTPSIRPDVADALRVLAASVGTGEGARNYSLSQVLVEVWLGSRRSGKKVDVVTLLPDGRIERVRWESPVDAPRERRSCDFDPQQRFEVKERDCFGNSADLAEWLEERLAANDDVKFGMYCIPRHSFVFNGAALLRLFREEDIRHAERLQKCWKVIRIDPDLYSHNAMNFVSSRHTHFDEQLYECVWSACQ